MKPRILVTGGAGYVGSHACKSLAAAGYVPVTIDNLARSGRNAVRWGPLEVGDIGDRARLDAVFAAHAPIAVVHFAGYAHVGESMSDPALYYSNNVTAGITLLEAMRDHEVDNLVFSSSCAIYGIPEQVPIREDARAQPVNPYGWTKLMLEQVIGDFGAAYGMRSIILRYFNAAGADPEGETGESHDPETHLIPLALAAAAGDRSAIAIHGTDYPTPDGTCVRDFVHVSDLADAHVLAIQALQSGASSARYNLGTGHGHSVREIIEGAKRVTGRELPVVHGARRAGDPPILVSDSSKIRADWGWTPSRSDLENILTTAWAWYRKSQHA